MVYRKTKRKKEILVPREVRAMMGEVKGQSLQAHRLRAVIAVFYRCAIRHQEMIELMPDDLDFDHHCLTVHFGKGNRRRVVAMDSWVEHLVRKWLVARSNLPGVTLDNPVFCNIKSPTSGGYLDQQVTRRMIKRVAKSAGIRKNVFPHSLRHTAAFEMANENIPTHIIQAILGHSNLATTGVYLDHLTPQKTIDVMRARPLKML